jgi:hypothetical protein
MPVAVRKPVSVGLTSLCALIGALLVFSAPAQAEPCPNEQLRTQDAYSLSLPDCRAYEQVSPVDKGLTDSLYSNGVVQAAPSGEGVTFYSLVPFPGVPGSSGPVIYLSTRGDESWSTQGLLPPSEPNRAAPVVGESEDLTDTIVEAKEELPLAPGATPGQSNYYVRDNATGEYHFLAPGADFLAPGAGILSFADATRGGSRIVFEDTGQEVIPGIRDETGAPYLYEWDNGQVRLIAPAAVAGAGIVSYSQNTISEDGSRVVFTDLATGRIYVREPEAEKTITVSAGSATWRAATPDGRYVFYTEGPAGEEELYRFDLDSTTPAPEPITGPGAKVLGTLGVSNEGSYAYFAAEGVLTTSENTNKETAEPGAANLYEWHQGSLAPTFIARLKTEVRAGEKGDESDWRDTAPNEPGQPSEGGKTSRVDPGGTTVLFSSNRQLTGYDNSGNYELYLFDAWDANITCVSCNPPGVPTTSGVKLSHHAPVIEEAGTGLFLTRNLSEDGNRVFFETAEALVPQDTNGVRDVYEWEREGEGTCESASEGFSKSRGGCVYLISTGQSSSPSAFGDASADGGDVFFFTRQSLVGQDQDNNLDVYDAREGGGIAAQNPAAPAPCSAEACRGALVSPPVFGAPSSATLSGAGNLTPPVATPPAKPKAKPLTAAQKRAKALKMCRRKRTKKLRHECEKKAWKRYPSKSTAGKAVTSTRVRKPAGGITHD